MDTTNNNIVIAHPKSGEQTSTLKAVLKALKIKFEVAERESPYNTAFVEKVMKSDEQAKNGKVKRIKKENLKAYLGV